MIMTKLSCSAPGPEKRGRDTTEAAAGAELQDRALVEPSLLRRQPLDEEKRGRPQHVAGQVALPTAAPAAPAAPAGSRLVSGLSACRLGLGRVAVEFAIDVGPRVTIVRSGGMGHGDGNRAPAPGAATIGGPRNRNRGASAAA